MVFLSRSCVAECSYVGFSTSLVVDQVKFAVSVMAEFMVIVVNLMLPV